MPSLFEQPASGAPRGWHSSGAGYVWLPMASTSHGDSWHCATLAHPSHETCLLLDGSSPTSSPMVLGA